MKRPFDIALSFMLILLVSPIFLIIALAVKLTSKGPVFHASDRIGSGSRIFRMYKFRTMKNDTPALPTHLLSNPEIYLTPPGPFLRRSSLDELPQLWNILKGDMSFVGPRPALFNQHDLIGLRAESGADGLLPGLTGWAQINGRDELPIPVKAAHDEYYLRHRSFLFDLKILVLTFLKVIKSEGVTH